MVGSKSHTSIIHCQPNVEINLLENEKNNSMNYGAQENQYLNSRVAVFGGWGKNHYYNRVESYYSRRKLGYREDGRSKGAIIDPFIGSSSFILDYHRPSINKFFKRRVGRRGEVEV